LGCHGAAILGSIELRDYLINFARSFIYTTGLSPHSVATILVAYYNLEKQKNNIEVLRENIIYFNQGKNLLGLKPLLSAANQPQSAIIPGNEKVKAIATQLQENGFDVKPFSPTVPEGQERLRFCLHSYNSPEEISAVMHCILSLL
jgi:8-amino-7-oxononanoate synthase